MLLKGGAARNAATILQNNISRMNENSGRLKALYLPYVGIIVSIMFTVGLSNINDWFKVYIHRLWFGGIMVGLLLISAIVFVLLDWKYLSVERKFRHMYTELATKYPDEIYDISAELHKTELHKKSKNKLGLFFYKIGGWSILPYYTSFVALITVAYFVTVQLTIH